METALEEGLGGRYGRFSRQLQNTSSPIPPLRVFVSSPSHLLPSLSVGPPCSTRKNREEKEHRVFFIRILITARQTKLAGVMRKIYKTVSSFCVLAFSVKKIDGFIMLLHCVHVWVQCARAVQSGGNYCDRWSLLRTLNPSCEHVLNGGQASKQLRFRPGFHRG